MYLWGSRWWDYKKCTKLFVVICCRSIAGRGRWWASDRMAPRIAPSPWWMLPPWDPWSKHNSLTMVMMRMVCLFFVPPWWHLLLLLLYLWTPPSLRSCSCSPASVVWQLPDDEDGNATDGVVGYFFSKWYFASCPVVQINRRLHSWWPEHKIEAHFLLRMRGKWLKVK